MCTTFEWNPELPPLLFTLRDDIENWSENRTEKSTKQAFTRELISLTAPTEEQIAALHAMDLAIQESDGTPVSTKARRVVKQRLDFEESPRLDGLRRFPTPNPKYT